MTSRIWRDWLDTGVLDEVIASRIKRGGAKFWRRKEVHSELFYNVKRGLVRDKTSFEPIEADILTFI